MDGLILTAEDLQKEVDYFLTQDAYAWDVESMPGPAGPGTRGIPTQNRVVWISFATYGRAFVVPMGHPNGDNLLQKAHTKNKVKYPLVYDEPPAQLRPSEAFAILAPLFCSDQIKIAHNAPFDFISVEKNIGYIPYGPIACTITLQWLLDENIGQMSGGPRRPHAKGLKELVRWYYGVDYDKEEVGKKIELHPFSKVARYALQDVLYDWNLYLKFREKCLEEELEPIRELEMATTEVVCRMGLIGAPVDVQAIRDLDVELTDILEEIEIRIYKAAGRQFNINSPKQKQEILYGFKKDGGQGLKPRKLTKTAQEKKKLAARTGDKFVPDIYSWSTDKEALEEFTDNELVQTLLEYGEVDKLRSTYVRGYLGDPDDPEKKPCLIFNGRIHTDLVQYGTVTGRFSSRAPNLQNIPRPDTELGKKVRGLFMAPAGYRLLVADYGQMELRILASMIGYGGLYDGFQKGIDAHTQTASLVFNVPVGEVTKWMRGAAKTLNFAIVYGAGPDKVAKMLKMTLEEAKELLANHRKAFPEIYKFKAKVIKDATNREIPHIRTMLGRVRRVWDLKQDAPDEQWKVWRAQRQLFNSLVQGSLGDIIKLAMVRLHKALKEDALQNPGEEIQLVLSVHDELVLMCPESRVNIGSALLKEAMLGDEIQDMMRVPLDVGDVAVCVRWSEAKE